MIEDYILPGTLIRGKSDTPAPQTDQVNKDTLNRRKFTYDSGDKPVAGYTIRCGIGVGGFGEVYFAVSDAGKEVALKHVQRNLDVELRGVKHCLNLKHVNLITLWDIAQGEYGDSWVVMEYVPGENLADVIHRNTSGMPADLIESWFASIAAGVGHLHQNGIVHRDLKPGNIFYDQQQEVVKIGDYGLSKFMSSQRSGQTESVGTFHYMAPEIGKGVYGCEIDIYALGIILFEMLTGRVPFDGESCQEIIMKHLTDDPDLSGIDPRYRKVVRKALRKDPERRFSSVAEMLELLSIGNEDGGGNLETTGGLEVAGSEPAADSNDSSDDQMSVESFDKSTASYQGTPANSDALMEQESPAERIASPAENAPASDNLVRPVTVDSVIVDGQEILYIGEEHEKSGDESSSLEPVSDAKSVAATAVDAEVVNGEILVGDRANGEMVIGEVHVGEVEFGAVEFGAVQHVPLAARAHASISGSASGSVSPDKFLDQGNRSQQVSTAKLKRSPDLWQYANHSVILKLLLVAALAAMVMLNPQFILPATVFGGLLFVFFHVLRMLANWLSGAGGQHANSRTTVRMSGSMERDLRDLRVREQLKLEPFFDRAEGLINAMLIAAGVITISALGLMNNHPLSGQQAGEWTLFGWLGLTALLSSWAILVAGKFFENSRDNSLARHCWLMGFGLVVGAISLGLGHFLLLDMTPFVSQHDPIWSWGGEAGNAHLASRGFPSLAAFALLFAGLFITIRWWRYTDPLRRTRLSLRAVAAAICLAAVFSMFARFPVSLAVLLTIVTSVAVQIGAPWIAPDQRDELLSDLESSVTN